MAIQQGVCVSFKQEVLRGLHNFSAGGSSFRIALYTDDADLSPATTVYTSADEVSGGGYTAGGESLMLRTPVPATSASGAAFTGFNNVTWSNAQFTVRGALIYNSDVTDGVANRAVLVIDLGENIVLSSGNFQLVFPTHNAANALIRFV